MSGTFSGAGFDAFLVISVAVIIRLLTVSGASHRPKIRGETKVYGIKWQVRLLVTAGIAGYAAFIAEFGRDMLRGEPWFLGFMTLIIVPAVVAATGSVTIGPDGVKMRMLWFVRSCRWSEVKEIRFNRNNGQIDIIGGPRKLPIDWRYATASILDEVVQRTGLHPIIKA